MECVLDLGTILKKCFILQCGFVGLKEKRASSHEKNFG
jgi:hypothetical protein